MHHRVNLISWLRNINKIEDVGGEYGYDEFLQAISNPDHPEHQDMLNWGRMQRYQDFSLEFANKRLKTVLRAVWER